MTGLCRRGGCTGTTLPWLDPPTCSETCARLYLSQQRAAGRVWIGFDPAHSDAAVVLATELPDGRLHIEPLAPPKPAPAAPVPDRAAEPGQATQPTPPFPLPARPRRGWLARLLRRARPTQEPTHV